MKFSINKLCFEIKFSFFLIIAFSVIFEVENVFFVFLFSVMHELGHILVLYSTGNRVDKIILSFNGIALKHHCRFTFLQEIVFLSGGLIINLMLAIFKIHTEINLALFIVNVLPVYPLDGGRILKLILNKFCSLRISDVIFRVISAVIFIALFIVSIYLRNLNLLLISIYSVAYSVNNSID